MPNPPACERSAAALMEFARMDGVNRLLGGKAVAFDMRIEGRVYVRCPTCRAEELAAQANANKET